MSAPPAGRPRPSRTTWPARSSARARVTRRGRARSSTPSPPIRSDDLFSAAATPADWIDLEGRIPQADEQQRLLANLITQMNLDRTPLRASGTCRRREGGRRADRRRPRHGNRGTQGQFDTLRAQTARAGARVVGWQCVRPTSYVFPDRDGQPAHPEEADAYQAAGFEIALHLRLGPKRPRGVQRLHALGGTSPGLDSDLTQLQAFHSAWPGLAAPVTSRTHCIAWSDWASEPKLELQHGIRFDTNYYYWPESWVQNPPGCSPARASRCASPTRTAR